MAKTKTQKPQVPEHVTTIRNFCQLLSATGAHVILASYDGSGDSGDMDISVQTKKEPLTTAEAAGQINTSSARTDSNTNWLPLRAFMAPIMAQKDSLITPKMLEEFIDAMYEFLPGGWEINDGSFGEINVNVASGKIEVEHSERVVEINTSNVSYE